MLSLFSRQNITIGIVLGFLVMIVVQTGAVSTESCVTYSLIQTDDSVEILLVLDHNYGGNVPFIINILERFEWSITTTGLNKTLTSCDYLGDEVFEVDLLIGEINNISEFDIISIMPGDSHDLLRTNQTALDLINAAVDEELVVSAWCRAVRVLAAAAVIDGKNITGNADYEAEYIAAGATFNELVPPIIDGNLVTGVRSRYYRDEMCQAIATAFGVYEHDAPVLQSATVTPNPSVLGADIGLTTIFGDATGVYMVNARIFEMNDTTGARISDVYVQYFALNETSTDGVFTAEVEYLEIGDYTIDFEVWDLYMNEASYRDGVNLSIIDQTTTTTPQTTTPEPSDPMNWLVPGAALGTICVVILVVFLRKR
jgi:putative intracellular protease/amidase